MGGRERVKHRETDRETERRQKGERETERFVDHRIIVVAFVARIVKHGLQGEIQKEGFFSLNRPVER